jgi:hypothetical protein
MNNYQYGHPSMYGATVVQQMQQKGPFVRGQRQSLNVVAICISLLIPWFIFCGISALTAFSLHYNNTFACYFLVFLGLLLVGTIGYHALDAVKKKSEGNHQPTWLIFLFATSFLAWLLGLAAGQAIFFNYMESYYDVSNLNTYLDVDPSYLRGQQMMDAGRLTFSNTTTLDLQRSMGFRNVDMFCVAPIVGGKDPKDMHTYDFWAVGMNCCSGTKADYHCGSFNDRKSRAGLRLMRDDQRAFYRLAVQQAEAAYKIRADHPLFFYWTQDPVADVDAWRDESIRDYLLGICSHFLLQFFLVCAACVVFSKLGGGLY